MVVTWFSKHNRDGIIYFFVLAIYYWIVNQDFLSEPRQAIVHVTLFCQMLRTCSLPDLSRLFSPQQGSAVTSDANVAPNNNLEIEDLDEAAKDDDQSETEE